MTDTELLKTEITDHESLMHVCDLLHDARCDMDAAVFEQEVGTWTATFKRLGTGSSVVKRGLVWDRLAIPLVESSVVLRCIASLEVRDQSGIGTYSFGGCVLKRGVYRLEFHEALTLFVRFQDDPQGELRDTRVLDEQDTSMHVLRSRAGQAPR